MRIYTLAGELARAAVVVLILAVLMWLAW